MMLLHHRTTFLLMIWFAVSANTIAAYAQQPTPLTIIEIKTVDIQGKSFTTLRGNLSVPLDYKTPKKAFLSLPVFIVKALDPDPLEPIFWLDGGPGGSNLLSVDKIVNSSPADLLQSHDLVCVGYRGVDGPIALEAPRVRKAMRGYRHELLSDASLDKINAAITATTKDLEKKDVQLQDYAITNVVEDIEYARVALKYEKIHFLSVSYGTRLALLYSYLYPDHLHRTLMIGASPPGCFLGNAENVERILDKYEILNQEQFPETTPVSLKVLMQEALEKMPRRWSVFRLNKDKVKLGTVNALYTTGFATYALDAYKKAALNNDYSGLFLLQKIYDMGRSKLLADVYVKTVSADANALSDPGTFRNPLRQGNTILGPNYALLYGGTYAQWKILPIEAALQHSHASAAATLIISGDLDFRTPSWEAEELLMPFLSNGRHLVLKNHSHVDLVKTIMSNAVFLQKYFEEGAIQDNLLPVKAAPDFRTVTKVGKLKLFVIGLIK